MQNIHKNTLKTTKENEEISAEIYDIYPSYLDTNNPNYIKCDDKYIACLMIINYNKEMEGGFLDKLLSLEMDMSLSIFYEKQNKSEIIKKLTYHIGNTGSDMKEIGENQVDSDIVSTTYTDAKYIRRELQIAAEDFYYVHIYISIYASDTQKLEQNMQRIEGIARGIGLTTRRASYRQMKVFNTCMPLMKNNKNLKELTRRNVLTSGLVSTYPFLSNELCDEKGVLLGTNEDNNTIVMVDRFDSKKYKNANMFVIGTSGSGKSYFTKLMTMRNRYMNIAQYIIDPEREYSKICKKLGGSIINFEDGNTINIMDIRETSKEEGQGYLQNKIGKLNTFFSLIFPEITPEERSLLEEKIIECYKKKKITFDDETLYKEDVSSKLITNKRFKKTTDMPILEDLYKLIKKQKKLLKISTLLKPYIDGSLKFFNGYTNIDLSNKLIVADIYKIEEAALPAVMYIITELFWDKIKEYRNKKKIIYLDEVWRLIGSNEETANFVLKIFKTIRKYGGAATAITQDINDFFVLQDGKYGRSILNNASIKCIFQLEENDIKILEKNINLSEEEIYKIQNAKRGKCLLNAGSTHIKLSVESSDMEHECM